MSWELTYKLENEDEIHRLGVFQYYAGAHRSALFDIPNLEANKVEEVKITRLVHSVNTSKEEKKDELTDELPTVQPE